LSVNKLVVLIIYVVFKQHFKNMKGWRSLFGAAQALTTGLSRKYHLTCICDICDQRSSSVKVLVETARAGFLLVTRDSRLLFWSKLQAQQLHDSILKRRDALKTPGVMV